MKKFLFLFLLFLSLSFSIVSAEEVIGLTMQKASLNDIIISTPGQVNGKLATDAARVSFVDDFYMQQAGLQRSNVFLSAPNVDSNPLIDFKAIKKHFYVRKVGVTSNGLTKYRVTVKPVKETGTLSTFMDFWHTRLGTKPPKIAVAPRAPVPPPSSATVSPPPLPGAVSPPPLPATSSPPPLPGATVSPPPLPGAGGNKFLKLPTKISALKTAGKSLLFAQLILESYVVADFLLRSDTIPGFEVPLIKTREENNALDDDFKLSFKNTTSESKKIVNLPDDFIIKPKSEYNIRRLQGSIKSWGESKTRWYEKTMEIWKKISITNAITGLFDNAALNDDTKLIQEAKFNIIKSDSKYLYDEWRDCEIDFVKKEIICDLGGLDSLDLGNYYLSFLVKFDEFSIVHDLKSMNAFIESNNCNFNKSSNLDYCNVYKSFYLNDGEFDSETRQIFDSIIDEFRNTKFLDSVIDGSKKFVVSKYDSIVSNIKNTIVEDHPIRSVFNSLGLAANVTNIIALGGMFNEITAANYEFIANVGYAAYENKVKESLSKQLQNFDDYKLASGAMLVGLPIFQEIKVLGIDDDNPINGYVVFVPTSQQIKQIEKDDISMDKYKENTKWTIKQNGVVIASTDSTDPRKLAFFKNQGIDWFFVVNNLTTLTDSENIYDVEVLFKNTGVTKNVKINVGAYDPDVKPNICTINMQINEETLTCSNPGVATVVHSTKPLTAVPELGLEVSEGPIVSDLQTKLGQLSAELEKAKGDLDSALKTNEELRTQQNSLAVKIVDLQIQLKNLETEKLVAQQVRELRSEKLAELKLKQTESANLSEAEKLHLADQIQILTLERNTLIDGFQKKKSEVDRLTEELDNVRDKLKKQIIESGLDAKRAQIEMATEEDRLMLTLSDYEEKEKLYIAKIAELQDATAGTQQCPGHGIIAPEIPQCSVQRLSPNDSRTINYNDLISLRRGKVLINLITYSGGLDFGDGSSRLEYGIVALGNEKFAVLNSDELKSLNDLKSNSVTETQLEDKAVEFTRGKPIFGLELIQVAGVASNDSGSETINDDGRVLVLSTNGLNSAQINEGYVKLAYVVNDPSVLYLLKRGASVWSLPGIDPRS